MKRSEGQGARGEGEDPSPPAAPHQVAFSPSPFAPRPSPLLFLIGYRGAGKTTVACLLARGLGWNWVDADDMLEQRTGRNIRAIFAEEGETGFREREASLLEELCQLREHVIATGGGVVIREANRHRMREAGKVIWLTADAPTIWNRLQGDAATGERRPNLTVGGLVEIEELLRQRQPWYAECADWSVDTTAWSPAEVAEIIRSLVTAGPS